MYNYYLFGKIVWQSGHLSKVSGTGNGDEGCSSMGCVTWLRLSDVDVNISDSAALMDVYLSVSFTISSSRFSPILVFIPRPIFTVLCFSDDAVLFSVVLNNRLFLTCEWSFSRSVLHWSWCLSAPRAVSFEKIALSPSLPFIPFLNMSFCTKLSSTEEVKLGRLLLEFTALTGAIESYELSLELLMFSIGALSFSLLGFRHKQRTHGAGNGFQGNVWPVTQKNIQEYLGNVRRSIPHFKEW